MKEPEQFRKEIDEEFERAKAKGISRMDLKWGMWSAEMNRELRIYTEKKSPKQILYKYVFVYWTQMSQLLELYHLYKNKFYGKGKVKRKKREIVEVVKILDLKTQGKDLTEEELLRMVVSVT